MACESCVQILQVRLDAQQERSFSLSVISASSAFASRLEPWIKHSMIIQEVWHVIMLGRFDHGMVVRGYRLALEGALLPMSTARLYPGCDIIMTGPFWSVALSPCHSITARPLVLGALNVACALILKWQRALSCDPWESVFHNP